MSWEERWHPLREEWVIVAAHRQNRPWQGATVGEEADRPPAYDPACYLCPGNTRVSGEANPDYADVFVFDNDHPCVGPDAPRELETPPAPYANAPASGRARVVCYHPSHNTTLAEMLVPGIEKLLDAWREQYRSLGAENEIRHVLVFENKGEVVGVSNPHPHCQIYGTNFVFPAIEREERAVRRYRHERNRDLFADVVGAELGDGRRVLAEHGNAVSFLPYFARYAYETFVAPKATVPSIADCSDETIHDLARVLKETLVRFDNLWAMSFPYVMALHQAPTDGEGHPDFPFHIEFHPPLRAPNLLKHLAGPEIGGGGFLSDTAPERKAAELKACSTTHYRENETNG